MRILHPSVVLVLVCTVTCLVVSRTHAQPSPTPVVECGAAVQSQANPYAQGIYSVVPTETVPSAKAAHSKAEHLRLAVEHLKAAGETEWAQQITKELLIEAKLEQIRKLQAEVERLRAGAETPQALTLQLRIVELQTREVRKLGLDFEATGGNTLMATGAIDEMIDALRANKLVKVLAEPTLVTVSGRPASIQSGGEIPIIVPQGMDNMAVEYRQTGTRVDCIGTVLESGRIRLELSSTISEVDAASSIMLEDISVPGLRTRKLDTVVEIEDGQTLILGGMSQKQAQDSADEDDDQEKSLLVAVTVHRGTPPVTTANRDEPRR